MIEIIFRNLATTYYPVGVCAYNEFKKYTSTCEYKSLNSKLNSAFLLIRQNAINEHMLQELRLNEVLKNVQESTLDSSDRCLTYKAEFLEGGVLYQLCINISVIVPYFYIYVLKNNVELNPYRWISLPERDKEAEKHKFKSIIKIISNTFEKKFLISKFPDTLVNVTIPNINYSDVELGNFTYFNAFFLDDVNL